MDFGVDGVTICGVFGYVFEEVETELGVLGVDGDEFRSGFGV